MLAAKRCFDGGTSSDILVRILEGEPDIFSQTIRNVDNGHAREAPQTNSIGSAAFKNLYDWTSRIGMKVWADKPMLLLATSPGGRGGATVLEAGKATFPRMGADLKASFSLASFYDHFDPAKGITDPELAAALDDAVRAFAT